MTMNITAFQNSLQGDSPPSELSPALESLWWDKKGNWSRAHRLVDELETHEAMAVHAYLHRKEGEQWNANYWYRRAGRSFYRQELGNEWTALVEALLTKETPVRRPHTS
jgi:hypothetical protein